MLVEGTHATVRIPVVAGTNPVTPNGLALNVHKILSVLAKPEHVAVPTELCEAVISVPVGVIVPLHNVTVQVAHAIVPVAVIGPPVIGLVVAMLVTLPPDGAPPSVNPPLESYDATCPDVPVPSEDCPLASVPCLSDDRICVH